MSSHKKGREGASAEPTPVAAGDFSAWLHATEASLRTGNGAADVPCGACTACCRSSMFIHIKPEETQTLRRIPGALLFPAPGLPKGHVLMGYNDKGHCPMLVDHQCSIYGDRPQTCRAFDCRIFAATAIPVDLQTHSDMAHRVKAWVFNHENEASREEHGIVQEAARFLQENRDLFSPASLPSQPVQLAALAIEIYMLFSSLTTKEHQGSQPSTAAEIAQAIMTAQHEPVAERTP